MKIVKTLNYKAGYRVETRLYGPGEAGNTEPFTVKFAFTPAGDFIGDHREARILTSRGIVPEKADPNHSVCSIGFCQKEQAWYGWSHRARWGFRIGDIIDGDNAALGNEKYPIPVGFEIKTLDDAKRCAMAFADNVS